MKKHLFVLLASLFIVMIGFGITLPVLTFYVERLALAAGAAPRTIVLHVTLLTSVYALMQLIFAVDAPLEQARRKLEEHQSTSLPVVNKAGGCCGTISVHSAHNG